MGLVDRCQPHRHAARHSGEISYGLAWLNQEGHVIVDGTFVPLQVHVLGSGTGEIGVDVQGLHAPLLFAQPPAGHWVAQTLNGRARRPALQTSAGTPQWGITAVPG